MKISRNLAAAFLTISFIANAAIAQGYDHLTIQDDLLSGPYGNSVPIATITRDALKSKMDRGERIFLVDVSDKKHFSRCHLPGAIQLLDTRRKAPHKLPDQKAEVVVYTDGVPTKACDQLARDLVAMGYTNVRIYPGGKIDWLSAGYPTAGSHPRSPEP